MEEKILIKSENYDIKKIRGIIFGISCTLVALGILLYLFNFDNSRGPNYWGEYWSIFSNMFDPFSCIPGLLIDLGIIIGIVSLIVGLWLKSYSMVITDKRIYGVVGWGRRVDLPVDSVSATGKRPIWKGVSVSSSSGRISFLLMKNADDIYNVLNNLMIERQQAKNNTSSNNTATPDVTEQLKKYKELLDSGVITQDEFDAKKKELLGL